LDQFVPVKVGLYNPLSAKRFSFFRDPPFQWADGGSKTPRDIRGQDWECPFDESKVEPSRDGRLLASAICFSIFVASLVICAVVWRNYWNYSVRRLQQRVEFSQSDIIVCGSMIICFFQYITNGPDFSSFAYSIHVIGNTLCADLEEIVDLKDGYFWIVTNI
jgi:hypothetical protein